MGRSLEGDAFELQAAFPGVGIGVSYLLARAAAREFRILRPVLLALRVAGSTEPDAIRQALAETKGFEAVTGEISYTRETMVPPKPVSIISVKDGDYQVEEIWKP